MPTRYLKPGIVDSPHIESIKSPQAEILYYRLLVTVDDFGRFDARPLVIKARCFPIRESVTSKQVSAWLLELQEAGLIYIYAIDSHAYIQVQRWDNKPRSVESKFPQMRTDADKCMQVYASADKCITGADKGHTLLPVTGTETETETVAANAAAFETFWKAYPRKTAKQKAREAWRKLDTSNGLLTEILEAVAAQSGWDQWTNDGGRYIPHAATWLHGKRWEDKLDADAGEDWRKGML